MWGRGVLIDKVENSIFVGHFEAGVRQGRGYWLPIGNSLKKEIACATWSDGTLSPAD